MNKFKTLKEFRENVKRGDLLWCAGTESAKAVYMNEIVFADDFLYFSIYKLDNTFSYWVINKSLVKDIIKISN